jgi:hypothetical protein
MPPFWMLHTPFVKMHHQLSANHIQKLSESVTRMSAPLPEASTLTMPDDEAIHEEYHIPVTTDRLVITHLILVEPKVILPMQIELVYPVPEAPSTKQRWHITECITAHKHIYVLHVFLLGSGFDYEHSTLTRQVLDLHPHISNIHCAYVSVCFGVLCSAEGILSQGGHKILHRMLFSILLTRQAEVDATIGIQGCYVKAFSTLNRDSASTCR